jgi:TonB family protein
MAGASAGALSDLPAPRSSSSDLPRGSFVYPVARPRSRAPLIIGLLVLSAAIGGGAMYLFARRHDDDSATASSKVVKVEGVEKVDVDIDAGVAALALDAAEPVAAIEIDAAIEAPAPADAAVAETPKKPPKKGREPKGTRGGKTTRVAQVTPPARQEPAPPQPQPPKPPKQDDGECGEVQCVLDKYQRPCCLKFKPQGGTFTPPVGGDPDKLQKAQIKAGVDRMKPRVIACGEQFKGVKGTVKVSMTVDPEGSVSDVNVTTAPDDGLGGCVADVMKKAKFAKTAGGGSFTYPFVF